MSNLRLACVLVLGDIGRSPRMQYHAASLASHGFHVKLMGYAGSKPFAQVSENKNITIQHLLELPRLPPHAPKLLYPIYAVLKVLLQSVWLFFVLLMVGRPECILVQTPPAIPTLLIVRCVTWILGAKFVIDWHNFGYSILGVTRSRKSLLVRISKWYERSIGRLADAHLCVTRAMKRYLVTEWEFSAKDIVVLHDRPPSNFRRLDKNEIHELLMRLQRIEPRSFCTFTPTVMFDSEWFESAANGKKGDNEKVEVTMLTERDSHGIVSFRADRPALIVSGTSWTEDEDFSVLLDAICKYDVLAQSRSEGKNLPKLIFVITGKGPLKEMYLEKIAQLSLEYVQVRTAWLAPGDYPLLLGAADMGVSLHKSSSGLDLPMKVVDMFGAGLPVFAFSFACIGELVSHGESGFCFPDSEQLSCLMKQTFENFNPEIGSEIVQKLREGVKQFQRSRWEDNWNELALPIFQKMQ